MQTDFLRSRLLLVTLPLTMIGLLLFSVSLPLSVANPKQGEIKDSLDRDYSSELPRIPATSPAAAMKTFQVQPGFRIEQAAAEPDVADPVAIAFDEDSRMFVVEMRGYSEDREKNLGQIRLLEDTDSDGRFDKSTVYADGLRWPTAVACYEGGVFVAAAPDLFYFKDTNDDGKADTKRLIYSGFGTSNVQGLVNTFKWGLDNKIYGAGSTNGGIVRSHVEKDAPPVTMRGTDFAIEPRSLKMISTSGGAQHGMSFDRWGNKFCCSNSDHIQLVMFEYRYIARNPYLKTSSARRSIASDGSQASVFRISPMEPWRVVRSRLRVKGIVKGAIEGGGKPAGYFTGATGVTIYRGDAFPPEYLGNAFVGDCGSNLVHRKRLEPRGVGQMAHRADPGREFLASRDIWFRPVQFCNAPDGALYVCDMSREVIEHPHSIPPQIKKHLDLTSGRGRGRIYRIVPEKYQQSRLPKLGKASTAELVALLDHPNGWHRDTASRLIYERQDRAAIEPLEKLTRTAKLAEGRIFAMYALDGMGKLRPEIVLARLEDEHPRVREHAIRVSESILSTAPGLRSRLYAMTEDADLRVRYQLAFTLGEIRSGTLRNQALAKILKRDGADSWLRLAVLSSLVEGAGEVFTHLITDEKFRDSKQGRLLIEEIASQIGAQNDQADVAAVLKQLQTVSEENRELAQVVVRGITRGAGTKHPALKTQLAAATGGKADILLRELLESSIKTALNDKVDEKKRVEAIQSLGIGTFDNVGKTLSELIDFRQPQRVQIAALSTLSQFKEPAVAEILIQSFAGLSPKTRSEALETLYARPERIKVLLTALEKGRFASSAIDPARAKLLMSHPDSTIRERASKLLSGLTLSKRADVIKSYRSVLSMKGNVENGRKTFRKVCAACHKLEGVGHEIGKNLAAVRNMGPETILTNVLDPNREVDPKYVNYIALTDSGRTYSGMIASETATSVTLKRAENASDTLLRIDIEEMRSSGQSIMPEGFEKQIDKQAFADLIAYLMSMR